MIAAEASETNAGPVTTDREGRPLPMSTCKRGWFVAPVLLLTLALGGCHSAKATADPNASAAAFCTDATAFKTALDGVKAVKVKTVGVSALAPALTAMQTAADALKTSAGTVVGSTIGSFETDLASLQATVAGLGGSGALAAPSGTIQIAVEGLVTSGKAVIESTKASCP